MCECRTRQASVSSDILNLIVVPGNVSKSYGAVVQMLGSFIQLNPPPIEIALPD